MSVNISGSIATSHTKFADTPVSKLQEQQPPGYNREIPVGIWADYHDVFGWLLPLEHEKYRPVEVGQKIHTNIDRFRETAGEFRLSAINVENELSQLVNRILRMHKVMRKPGSSDPKRYYNPNWVHFDECVDPITETSRRKTFFTNFSEVGTIDLEWIGEQCNMQTAELIDFIRSNTECDSPRNRIKTNKRKVTRSLYTGLVWTDEWNIEHMANTINTDKETVKTWMQRWVSQSDWNPPERPTKYEWFKHSSRRR